MFSNFKKYGCVPGGTPLAKVIGREGMANIAAAATEPPAAATAGAASSIASKTAARVSANVSSGATSATVSTKVSSASSWQILKTYSVNNVLVQSTASSQLVRSGGHLKRYGQNQASIYLKIWIF